MYKKLGSIDGAPMCVIMPRNVGNMYFYDVTEVELIPESTNFLHLEDTYKEEPKKLESLIREALKRYRILMPESLIDLLIEG